MHPRSHWTAWQKLLLTSMYLQLAFGESSAFPLGAGLYPWSWHGVAQHGLVRAATQPFHCCPHPLGPPKTSVRVRKWRTRCINPGYFSGFRRCSAPLIAGTGSPSGASSLQDSGPRPQHDGLVYTSGEQQPGSTTQVPLVWQPPLCPCVAISQPGVTLGTTTWHSLLQSWI